MMVEEENYKNYKNNYDNSNNSTYLLVVDKKLWSTFKATASMMGLKLRDAMALALSEFVERHGSTLAQVNVNIVQSEAKENLLQLVIEEEIKEILNEIIRIKKLLSSNPKYQVNHYEKEKMLNLLEDNKRKLISVLKKHPIVNSNLAQEIKIALKNIGGTNGNN